MRIEDFPDPCAHCGGEMPWRSLGGVRRKKITAVYCSKKCSAASTSRLLAAARAEARAGRTCPGCGVTYDAERATQVWCTRRCYHRAYMRARRAALQGIPRAAADTVQPCLRPGRPEGAPWYLGGT